MNTEPMPRCPQCGELLPPDAPDGLCPKCVMALNLKTETVFTDDTPAAQPPLPPEQVAPYFPQLEILECLGRGGMGVVYKARQKTLNRFVALKLLAPERVQDAKFAERFTREAQALAALNHPNIVTIYDFGQAGGFYYLLMEYVDGLNLRQLLRTRKFTPEEALVIVPSLCDALQFAHDRGIVHRDIKPENLLLDKTGKVKVADFGIAKMLGTVNSNNGGESAAPANATQSAVGTPSYSAPEQKTNPQRVDNRADIYSLGVVFYEMLTGELPGKRIEPPSSKVQIDVRLDEVVLRALEKKPELRYQQVSEVKTMVETIVATPPGSSRHEAQTEKAEIQSPLTSAPTKKELYFSYKVISGVIAAIVLLMIMGAIYGRQFLADDNEWRAQPMKWAQAKVSNPLASIRITAIERAKNIVIFKVVSDAGFPFHLLTAQYKGPYITNLPISKAEYQYTGPDLNCLLSPAESTAGYGDGTSYIGGDLAGWMGIVAWTPTKVFHMSNKQIGPGEFLYGFYLPDEPTAALVVEQGRDILLGKTNLLGESANLLTFFDLKRRAGKDQSGNTQWQQLTGSLMVTPDYNLSFGPVIEQVLTMNGEEPSDCLNLVSGKIVPLPKYALGGFLPAGAEVPPATSLPTGIGVFRRIPDPNEKVSLYASGGMVLRFLSNEQWESMTTAELLTLARTMQSNSDPAAWIGNLPPATFLFKTPNGLAGLLQLTGFTENPPGVKIRYKLLQNNVTTTISVSLPPADAPDLSFGPENNNPIATPALLAEPPKLQFLVWQDEWVTNRYFIPTQPDGSPVTDPAELKLARSSQLIFYNLNNEIRLINKYGSPRLLTLWFWHPAFELDSWCEVSLIDESGRMIPQEFGSAGTTQNNHPTWQVRTLVAGSVTNLPKRVTVRLRYTVGPLERTNLVLIPQQKTSASLEGESMLNGVGQTVDGSAFVSIAVNSDKMKSRKFGVVAIAKDGRELTTCPSESGFADGSGASVAEFDFGVPLADVAKFIIGTHPIRTMEWKNVVLP